VTQGRDRVSRDDDNGPIAIHLVPCTPEHLPVVAERVAARVRSLAERVPALPRVFTSRASVAEAVEMLVGDDHCLIALDGDDVVGHIGWFEFPTFRRAQRRAVWIPEFGISADSVEALEALHLMASHRWAESARQVISVTLLADDASHEDWWVTNGFGRMLHDTVRPCGPIEHAHIVGLRVRAATVHDTARLEALDVEHCAHYGRPPVFMVPPEPTTAGEWAALVHSSPEAVWVADAGADLVGFIRFEPSTDGLRMLRSPDSVTVTGIYTQPAVRNLGLATALLSAGMAAHHQRGVQRVAIDHETTNPPALHFWPRHTTTVAIGLMRVLERL
jgi:GNAT superfamily N-acetyltransferase